MVGKVLGPDGSFLTNSFREGYLTSLEYVAHLAYCP